MCFLQKYNTTLFIQYLQICHIRNYFDKQLKYQTTFMSNNVAWKIFEGSAAFF